MGRIFESQVVGYLAYRKSPVGYPFFGGIYHVELDVFLRRTDGDSTGKEIQK